MILACLARLAGAKPVEKVVGDLRVEVLSPTLVRIEQKGAEGFENRKTFHVMNRDWDGGVVAETMEGKQVVLKTARWSVHVSADAKSLADARIESADGRLLWAFDGKLTNNVWLPGPGEHPMVWAIADAPRMIRPPQGAVPETQGSIYYVNSGWDTDNNAPDVYVFLPNGDAGQVRTDFLKLTGHTEMPPLFALGSWDSRWYDYTEQTALEQINNYRKHDIPLDVLVIDTDWRVGGSHGYQVETKDFPDLARFFKEAHARHVRVMFNDHPEPVATSAVDPKEMQYRFDNLSRLLNEGLDIWWFDRNWRTHLLSPMPGLRLEAWGMEVYHDTTLAVHPDRRPMIMANVDGNDHGLLHAPPDMATHRYPIQWTGDIQPRFDYLRKAVENTVHSGVAAAFAYESDDLGGHLATPTNEQYIRWIEYGALSPIYRPHCTHNLERMPWVFGPEVEKVARDYIKMRYRLLPVLYAAARENYETGEPILRRLDLDYPQYAEASGNDEYLIGHDILVAPILSSMFNITPVPTSMLQTPDGKPGLAAEYFDNRELAGNPVLKRVDPNIDVNWHRRNPAPQVPADHFGVRWTGTVGPIPTDGTGERILGTLPNDSVRIWIDGKKVLDQWDEQNSNANEAAVSLAPGKTYKIEIDYRESTHVAMCQLNWRDAKASLPSRKIWLPPGTWVDAWTGRTFAGPGVIQMQSGLERIPLLIKAGSIVPLAPEMQYTGEKAWDPITLDVYPAGGAKNQATLYEDDGISNAYTSGAFRKTKISFSADQALKTAHIKISAGMGSFAGALESRSWVVRVHLPNAGQISGAEVDGQKAQFRRLAQNPDAMPFSTIGGAADGDVIKINLPSQAVANQREVMIRF